MISFKIIIMNQISIIATTGNGFNIPGGAPVNQVTYGRILMIQNFQRNSNVVEITFDINEMARLRDFKSRIDHLGGDWGGYLICRFPEETGFISRIYDTVLLSDLIVGFEIFKENIKKWDDIQYI